MPSSAKRAAPRRPAVARRPRARKPPADDAGSRQRLLAAAAAEFAARGFAGANVDRIAAAARLNKAMIYYHFASKGALYQEIVGDMFHAVGARVRAVAASAVPPRAKLQQFVEAIAVEAEARPHFPPIWFREIAEGGVHLADATLQDIAGIVQTLVGILQEGRAARQFRPINPVLVHGSIIAPLLLFFASAPVRRRLQQRAGLSGVAELKRDEVVEHIQRVILGLVEGKV